MKKTIIVIVIALASCMLYAEGTTVSLCGSFDRLKMLDNTAVYTGSSAFGLQIAVDHTMGNIEWLNLFASADVNLPMWLYDGTSSKAWTEDTETYAKSFRYAGKARLGAEFLLPYLLGGYMDLKLGLGVYASYLRVRRISLEQGIDVSLVGAGACALVCADIFFMENAGLRIQGCADMCIAVFRPTGKPVFGFALGFNAAAGVFYNF